MRYLWELALKVQAENLDLKAIHFEPAQSFSPYLELSQPVINQEEVDTGQSVEINPYFRFHSIFKDMFHPDLQEYEAIRKGLFQVMIHQLVEFDLKKGMNRNEYYKKFIYQDILSGCYGEEIKVMLGEFSLSEQHVILSGLLKLYLLGDSVELLKEILSALFSPVILYNNLHCNNELLIYIGKKKTTELQKKVELILKLFMNFRYQAEIYYQYHFGILAVAETCRIDEISLY